MKRISLIGLLTLIMTVVSFNGKAQEVSTVIVSGRIHSAGPVYIETIKPDYSVESKDYDRKEEKNLLVEIKKELDFWINKGYTINQTNSNGGSAFDYKYTYILIKKEE